MLAPQEANLVPAHHFYSTSEALSCLSFRLGGFLLGWFLNFVLKSYCGNTEPPSSTALIDKRPSVQLHRPHRQSCTLGALQCYHLRSVNSVSVHSGNCDTPDSACGVHQDCHEHTPWTRAEMWTRYGTVMLWRKKCFAETCFCSHWAKLNFQMCFEMCLCIHFCFASVERNSLLQESWVWLTHSKAYIVMKRTRQLQGIQFLTSFAMKGSRRNHF